MSVLVQKVSTGDTIVFDKETRDLVLIDRSESESLKGKQSIDMRVALSLAKKGRAQHFDRHALAKIQAALAGVVLLV